MPGTESVVGLLFPLLFVIEWWAGAYGAERMSRADRWLNAVSFIQDRLVQPAVAVASLALWAWALPGLNGTLAGARFAPALVGYALVHELVHYAFHRWAHHSPTLWRIHRAHHTAREMSVVVAPRAHIAWQAILPVNYLAGLALHLGIGPSVLAFFAFRTVVGTLGHSNFRVDLPLYRSAWLGPIVWLFEHVVTTPDAHHAHHGIGTNGAPQGNFAPTLILWDVLFGTYHAPHARQSRVGCDDTLDDHWAVQLYWPLVRRAPSPRVTGDPARAQAVPSSSAP